MKLLGYLFNVSRFFDKTKTKNKTYFIMSTIGNFIASGIILLLLVLSLACFDVEGRFIPTDLFSSNGGSIILIIFGVILLIAVLACVIKNIPYQIILTIVGFKRSKEGAAFLVCGIISLLSMVALIALIALIFMGI